MIDYYNELPHSVNVIDKMNIELSEIQKENEKLKIELEGFHKLINRFNMPRIKVDTVEEYQLFESKLEEFKNFIEDENGFIYKFVNKLDKLTNHLNREWCENRILTAFEMMDKLGDSINYTELLEIIIYGELLPKTYCELSNKFIPEWSQRDENINMLIIPYYKCEKCDKYDDYGETEVYGGLFCIDCLPSP